MTLGSKIKKLRVEKGLTQKDLADQVHVTFQTVSKWEKDENEPDVSTLRELSKLFNCSMDYLLSEDDVETPKQEEQPVTKTIIVHQNDLHVCARCGKDIPEVELASEDVTKKERHGRTTRTVTIGQTYYHRDCLEQTKKEREEAAAKARALKANSDRKKSFGWGIAGGIVAFVITLLVLLLNQQLRESVHPALSVLFAVIAGYGIFSMLYCIISGSYIGEVFIWCASLSIKFPGLIFSWDIEGIIWVIVMKVLFAIIGFIIGVLALLFAIAFSALLGMFSFPFVLIHNNRTNYEDAL